VPTIADLELALAAVDTPNLAALARAHHVSQSTMSRALQRVEAEIGPLFVRQGRSLRAADDAAARVAGLRDVIDAWHRLTTAATSPARLTIFCTVTASQTIAPDLLRRYRHHHPDVDVELRTGPASQALEAARRGEVDAAIAPLPDRLPASMASIHLADTSFVAVSARPSDADWSAPRLVVPRSGLTRSLIERWCRSALHGSWTVQETDTHEEAVALAAVGPGIAVVPGLVFEASPLRRLLGLAPPPRALPVLRIGLVARRTAITGEPLGSLWAMSIPPAPPIDGTR
jgi:LysR family positive regulator for ilvC